MVKDHYVLHKKSIKLLKTKQYKAWRGENNVVPEYTLPAAYHIDEYKKVLKKMEEMKKEMGVPDKKFSKEDVSFKE